jgi:transcriptional regulator with XRE-family HTH domain
MTVALTLACYNGSVVMPRRPPHIGDAIRAMREDNAPKKITLVELAARSKVDKSTISKIERGKQKPETSTLDKLASALGLFGSGAFYEKLSDLTRHTLPAPSAGEGSRREPPRPDSLEAAIAEIQEIVRRLYNVAFSLEARAARDAPPSPAPKAPEKRRDDRERP